MKTLKILSLLYLALILTSCVAQKKISNDALFASTWELDYLSGPRITFAGLFPDKKPTITFNKDTKKVTGNSGCNGYAANFILNGNQISFGEPGISTMIYCGDGEKFFLNTIKKVERFEIDDQGKLNLMYGKIPVMRFKKLQ